MLTRRRLAAAAAIMAATLAAWILLRPREAPPAGIGLVTFPLFPPPRGAFTPTESSVEAAQLAVSLDGREIAFVASAADGVSQLWTRPLASRNPEPVPGTQGATYPFWSPKGDALGFFADKALKRIDPRGGPPRVLAPAPNGRGGTWGRDDIILFAPDAAGALYRVRADGSDLAQQTSLLDAQGHTSHRWPQFLPDGRTFLWFARSTNPEHEGMYAGALDSDEATLILRSQSNAVYAPPDQLLYLADGSLLARTLDVSGRRLVGDPKPVADLVGASSSFYSAVSASATGVIAYATSAFAAQLAWFDRKGRRLGVAAASGPYVDFQLSPDDRSVAIALTDPITDRSDIRIWDLLRGVDVRLTSSRATDASPVWSPDGARLVFRSNRESVHDLYSTKTTGLGTDQLFLKTPVAKRPTDWSIDGNTIVFQAKDDQTQWDVWAMPWPPGGEPRPLVRTQYNEAQGRLSPNGRWLAYTSDETSQPEVFVAALAGGEQKSRISVDGGVDPQWSADGRELFYVTRDGMLAVVRVNPDLPVVKPGVAQMLFPVGLGPSPFTSNYDVARDGRILVRVLLEDVRTQPLTVLVNWSAR